MTLILLTAMLMSALWAVLTRALLKSAIALAITSVLLTLIMFQLNSPLAAVFELSVCAGLITVIFISTISLTSPEDEAWLLAHAGMRFKRYWFLPVLLAIVVIALFCMQPGLDFVPPEPEAVGVDVRNVLWNTRQLDLLGQVVIILTGVFGVVVLFKEKT